MCFSAGIVRGLRPHRGNQGLRAEYVDRSFHVVCQHVQAHLRSDARMHCGQEMRGAHPELERTEWVLNCLSPQSCSIRDS